MACAFIAEELAELTDQGKDRAYTTGLLHDVGRLVLLTCFPDEYDNLLSVAQENDFDLDATEQRMFEIDHCSAGEWLCTSWKLPEDMCEVIARHHEENSEPGSLVSLISASDRLAAALGYGTVETSEAPELASILSEAGIQDVEAGVTRLNSLSGRISEAIAVINSLR